MDLLGPDTHIASLLTKWKPPPLWNIILMQTSVDMWSYAHWHAEGTLLGTLDKVELL